jgi:hypothetical protein
VDDPPCQKGANVTARRYRNYRRALDLIAAVDPLWLSSAGRALLDDRAEELLLSRAEDRKSISRLQSEAARFIRHLVGEGLLPQAVADELTELILAAGPSIEGSTGPRLAKAPRAA